MRSALLGGAAALVLLAGCGGSSSAEDPAAGGDGAGGARDGLTVVTTSHPLEYVASTVAGDRAAVSNLVAPGADSHDAEISTRQLADVTGADVVVHLSGLQPAVDDALSTRPPAHLVDAARYADDERDPHFWLDPVRMADLGEDVAAELSEVDPDHAAAYAAGAGELRQRMEALDADYAGALAGCRDAALVTSHEAFGYLAGRYGLRQVGIAGIDPSVEPSPARIRDVLEVARENAVTTIFFESTANPAVAEKLAAELGVRTAVLHPVERVDADEDYLGLMRENLDALRSGLACS
ncbi:zinc transport system substrate-binding protein [Kineococcus radiotolerans]|uniref:Zinc transport system substrate-binding protein n=1 Tax=Kineococcus radiotolerans TaxID=131568 RepID=A0A7W4TP05_KINRA|nr:metal ABC transporter substrate-binding protein [Kineococcus radiotolerans]MBB2902083.1 zinc transport system substrate-binding protein [Kineococcus radiotolerans]